MMTQDQLYCNDVIEAVECPAMGQDGIEKVWPASWTAQIGSRLQRYRKAAGLSAAALSGRCSDVGYPIPRSTIANLESGRKEAVPIHEIVVLSKALGLPPLALLYGIDEPDTFRFLPNVELSAWNAWNAFADGLTQNSSLAAWARGEPYQTIKEALISYMLITENAKAWRRVRLMLDQYDALKRENSALRQELQDEMQQILTDTYGAIEFLHERSMPLPDVPADWMDALVANDSAIDALVQEDDDA